MPSLLHRASGSLALKALPAIYGLGLILLVVRALPLAEFGQYGMAIAYVNLIAYVSRGLWMIPFVVQTAGGKQAQFHGPALWLSLAMAMIGAIVAQILLPLLGVNQQLAMLAGIMQLLLVPRDLIVSYFQAHQRTWIAFTIDAGYFVGGLIGFALLAIIGQLHTAVAAFMVNLAATVISVSIALAYESKLVWIGFEGDWRGIFHFGRWIGILALGEMFFQQADALLVGAFFSAEAIAPYLAARTLLRMYGLLSQSINFLVLPGASRLKAEGQVPLLRRRLRKVLLLLDGALLPVNVLVWFISPVLFPWVLGAKYVAAIPFFQILIFATFLEPIYSVLTNAFAGIGKPWATVPVITIAIILNITANVILLPTIGLLAAPAVLVGTYAVLAIGSYWISRRKLFDSV